MSRETPQEWQPAIREAAAAATTALVIGTTDTGKTAFVAMLASAAQEAGRTVAIVDSDLGQSEIGPPACVGLGMVEQPILLPRECRLRSIAFVGATSPRGRMLEHSAGTYKLVRQARAAGAALCIVDTTGFVLGHAAARLKRAKIELLRPDYLFVLERSGECGAIVAPYRNSSWVSVQRLGVPTAVRRKTAEVRAVCRQGSFASYFSNGQAMVLDMDEVALEGTWLQARPSLESKELLYIGKTLGVEVLHAELGWGHLGVLVVNSAYDNQATQELRERYRCTAVTITSAAEIRHLLVGLLDAEGECLGMGTLEQLDLTRRALTVVTPVRSRAAVRTVAFGLQRVTPNGREQGALRPGTV